MSEIGQQDWKGRGDGGNQQHHCYRVLNHAKIGNCGLNLGRDNNKDLKNQLVLLKPLIPRLYWGRLERRGIEWNPTDKRLRGAGTEGQELRKMIELPSISGSWSLKTTTRTLWGMHMYFSRTSNWMPAGRGHSHPKNLSRKAMKSSRGRTATEGHYLKKYFFFLLPN